MNSPKYVVLSALFNLDESEEVSLPYSLDSSMNPVLCPNISPVVFILVSVNSELSNSLVLIYEFDTISEFSNVLLSKSVNSLFVCSSFINSEISSEFVVTLKGGFS